jgi:hypothetical protein
LVTAWQIGAFAYAILLILSTSALASLVVFAAHLDEWTRKLRQVMIRLFFSDSRFNPLRHPFPKGKKAHERALEQAAVRLRSSNIWN